MSVTIREDECRAAGIDPAEVRKIALRLARAARDAHKLGMLIFGGAHSGSLRDLHGDTSQGRLVLAEIDSGSWDGGDGGAYPRADGLTRGEG